jgi:cytochrome c553
MPPMPRAKKSRQAIVGLGTVLMWSAGLGHAAAGYIDLRELEPVHGDAAAGARKAAVCQACHGVGAPLAPTFPRLAGQRADYLYYRLISFKAADAGDPYYSKSPMRAQVANLSRAELRNLAVYYAAQTPAAGTSAGASAALTAKGQALYLTGDASRGIPPCQGCHGADARGTSVTASPYAAYPALRGQYAMYVTARLTAFHHRLPHNTTNDFIMSDVAATLDDDSIQAIAAWLGSLTPQSSR